MTNIDKYVIVRTQNAGAWAGTLISQTDTVVELANARRLWYWKGANCLSDLSVYGVKKPNECKFPIAVETVTLSQWIEVIPATPEAKASIEGVKEWQA
jgi:hypothetical protein